MIRYAITDSALQKAIEREKSGWLDRARKRTHATRKTGKFTGNGIWGEIKQVYVTLQCGKCAYCERGLPTDFDKGASVEWDVEHFRPKGRVTPWSSSRATLNRYLKQSTGKGYHLLAHNYWNYAAACKFCNSGLKSDAFPIEGKRNRTSTNIVVLNKNEKPLLLFPLGTLDADPETLLTFDGMVPQPVAKRGHKRRRAQATIEFFALLERHELRVERALLLTLCFQQKTSVMAANTHRHANCVRSFQRLMTNNPALAKKRFEEAREYLRQSGNWLA